MSDIDDKTGPAEAETTRLRRLGGWAQTVLRIVTVVSLLLCVNQMFNLRLTGGVLLDNQYFYLLLALLLPPVFLLFPGRSGARLDRPDRRDWVLAAASFAGFLYLCAVGYEAIQSGWEYGGAPDTVIWTSGLLWLVLLEGLRRTGGWGLMLPVALISAYPLFADSIPQPLSGVAVSLPEAAAYHLISTESVLGVAIKAFAQLVIGFLIFGVALQYTGAGEFFINLAFALFGHVRGGAAKVAIFASGLLGSMSGSIITNVLTAGTMTIPAMMRTGFRPSYAASVEACASTGAVLMPPVMGAVAFVMAEFLAVPYSEVALAAAIPSILYYFGLFMQVDAYAARHGLKGLPREELPRLGAVVKKGWYYLFVVALLIWMLLVLKRESTAPFYATALLLAINQVCSRDKRWGWAEVKRFIDACCNLFSELVAILAGVGLLIGAFSVTGLTGTLSNDLIYMAGDQAIVLLFMGAITSFVLGLGLTTTACYIFLAVLLAPALVKAGLHPMAVHLFILYWGMLSSITPPVAIASFAAASIARSDPVKTSFESMWVGSIIYFIPFFFVLNPGLIGIGPWREVLQLAATAVVGVALICAGLQGALVGVGDLRACGAFEWPARVLLVLGGLLLAAPGGGLMPLSGLEITLLGIAFAGPAVLVSWWLARRSRAAARAV